MEFRQASVLRRTGAFIFDHFLASLLGIISGVIYSNGLPTSDDSSMTIALSVTFGLFFCRDLVKGISPGRWVAGITVRDYDDPSQVPSVPKRLLRNIFHVLWPVEALSMLFDREFRRLGDKAGNSVVVLNPRKVKVGYRIIPVIVLITGFVFFTFFFSFFAIKRSEPYMLSVAYLKANPEVKEITGGITGFGPFPAGNISITNGVGEAELMVHVMGEKKDVVAVIGLVKVSERWEVETCEFQ